MLGSPEQKKRERKKMVRGEGKKREEEGRGRTD